MKTRLLSLLFVALVVPLATAEAARCSCKAPGCACEASITCTACGCGCVCPRSGDCACECFCFSPALLWGAGTTSAAAVNIGALDQVLDATAPYENLDASQLSVLLTDALGVQVTFTPSHPETRFGFNLASPRQAIGFLSRHGTVKAGGRDVSSIDRTIQSSALRDAISLEIREGNVAALERFLSRALGAKIEIQLDTPDDMLDFEARDLPLGDVLRLLSGRGTVLVNGRRLDFAR